VERWCGRGGRIGIVLWPDQGEEGRGCASYIPGKVVRSLEGSENRLAMKDYGGGKIGKVNGGKLIKF